MIRPYRLVLALWLGVVPLMGDGADDAFIRVYNLIQQADAQREAGRLSDARELYGESLAGLRAIQQNYPSWNERVIGYRLRYVTERLSGLKDAPPKTAAATNEPARAGGPVLTPAAGIAPGGEVLAQFEQLNDQIRRMASEKQLLEARLREALSAQPAPVDPREFQAAVERIAALQSTNKALVASLEAQQADRRNLVEKVVADEAREALNEANRKLLEQRIAAGRIEKEKAEIEARLKSLQEGPVRSLQTENTALRQQVAELKTDTERGRQVAELAGRLSRLQTDLEEVKRRNETLAADKASLEQQLEDLRARSSEEGILRIRKLETDLAAARANSERSASDVDRLSASLTKERQARGDLEMANRSLETRVADLTRSSAESAKAVKALESTLAAERAERDAVLGELKAAEQKLAAMTTGATNVAEASSAKAAGREAESAALRSEIGRLRTALKDGTEREADLRAALKQEGDLRRRMASEKADLEKRLAAALAAPPVMAASPVAVAATTKKALSGLENRVRDLEKERDRLQSRLEEFAEQAKLRLAKAASARAVTPRERVVEFRSRSR